MAVGEFYEYQYSPALMVVENPPTIIAWGQHQRPIVVEPEQLRPFSQNTELFSYRYLIEEFWGLVNQMTQSNRMRAQVQELQAQVNKAIADFEARKKMVLTHLYGHVQTYGTTAEGFWRKVGLPDDLRDAQMASLAAEVVVAIKSADAPKRLRVDLNDFRLAKFNMQMMLPYTTTQRCYCTEELPQMYAKYKPAIHRGVPPENVLVIALRVNRCATHTLPMGLSDSGVGEYLHEG